MDWRTSYHDLCKEIEVLELRASDLEYQMKLARGTCFSGYVPSDHQIIKIPLDIALEHYDDIKDKLLEVIAVLEHKQMVKTQMEQRMDKFSGLEYQVAYMRDIKCMPLDAIADKLGYSYDWIKKVSRRTSEKALSRHPQVDIKVIS